MGKVLELTQPPKESKEPKLQATLTMSLWEAQRHHKLLKTALGLARQNLKTCYELTAAAGRNRMAAYEALSWFETQFMFALEKQGFKDFSEFQTIGQETEETPS